MKTSNSVQFKFLQLFKKSCSCYFDNFCCKSLFSKINNRENACKKLLPDDPISNCILLKITKYEHDINYLSYASVKRIAVSVYR